MARKKKDIYKEPEISKNEDQEKLDLIGKWKQASENALSAYQHRWAKNLKLLKGIWPEDEATKSRVRNRSKIYFRKIWATNWRLLASLYNAFLRDQDSFNLEPRGPEDTHACKVLEEMVKYRRDYMMRRKNLFINIIWAFQNILNFGWTCGKLRWEYDGKKDEPDYATWPNEQVFPDLNAETSDKMRFIIFESYMTKEDLEEAKYENIEKANSASVPSSQLRNVRNAQTGDPIQNPGAMEYPSPGKYAEGKQENIRNLYCVWEVFYKEEGEWMFCVTSKNDVFFKKPILNPYGDITPDIMGVCLTEPHKMLGEGFPEVLEGPQESFNANLNMRKDNVALALNKGTIVSRYGGVDLQSLVNSRPGGITLADDVNAVKERDIRDVTQSSYTEALVDDAMIQEMSGVTPGKQGMGSEEKATTSQINYTESNAKIDLFIAMVGETFMKSFWYKLAKLESRFETDERVLRVANDNFKKNENTVVPDVYDFDIDFDCTIDAGSGTTGKDMELKQAFLAIDRATTSNQASAGLVALYPGQNIQVDFFNVAKMIIDHVLPKLGIKNVDEYKMSIPAPPAPTPTQGSANNAQVGATAPQIGGRDTIDMINELQRGGQGGI